MTTKRSALRFAEFADRMYTSLWSLPAALSLAGAGLALGVIHGLEVPTQPNPWTRDLVSTIAGSTMTISGVVFSGTVVARTLASQQFGPRTLRTFERDLATQIALGGFAGAYVFCVTALAHGQALPRELGYTAALIALATTACLVLYIHALARSLHVSRILRRHFDDFCEHVVVLQDQAREERHEEAGRDSETPEAAAPSGEPSCWVRADRSGFVRTIDVQRLTAAMDTEAATMQLLIRVGDFVSKGQRLAAVHGERVAAERCLPAIRIGGTRRPIQDVRFTLEVFVEVAVRALSPGINDPRTAIDAVHYLGASFVLLAGAPCSSPVVRDGKGRVVLFSPADDVGQLLDGAAERLQRAAEGFGEVQEAFQSRLRVLVQSIEDQGEAEDSSLRRVAERWLSE